MKNQFHKIVSVLNTNLRLPDSICRDAPRHADAYMGRLNDMRAAASPDDVNSATSLPWEIQKAFLPQNHVASKFQWQTPN
jgi:hypothetical protein